MVFDVIFLEEFLDDTEEFYIDAGEFDAFCIVSLDDKCVFRNGCHKFRCCFSPGGALDEYRRDFY